MMRIAFILAACVLTSGCASDKYFCFPASTCRRAEEMYKSIGHLECLSDQMKALERREREMRLR